MPNLSSIVKVTSTVGHPAARYLSCVDAFCDGIEVCVGSIAANVVRKTL